MSWDNVTGKPEYYPPENHGHTIDQIEDLYNELRDINTSLDSKAEWPHKHDMSAIVDLEEDLGAIQSDIANKANATHTHAISDVTNLQTTLNGKAASSHNHSASNITSGTLPTSRGGTGITTNPSMLINLGSTSAASVFATSPRPGVTGTLPVARGGTGVTSISALKIALGIPSTIGVGHVLWVRSGRSSSNGYKQIITFDTPITAAAFLYGRVHRSGQYENTYFGIGWGTGRSTESSTAICQRGGTLNIHTLSVNSSNKVMLESGYVWEGALSLSSDGKTLTIDGSDGERRANYIEGLVIAF